MPPHELLEWLTANPFTPFRIHLSDRRVFDITRPNQVFPGRQTAVVGIPSVEDPRYFDRHATISLMHITSVEPLATPTTAG